MRGILTNPRKAQCPCKDCHVRRQAAVDGRADEMVHHMVSRGPSPVLVEADLLQEQEVEGHTQT